MEDREANLNRFVNIVLKKKDKNFKCMVLAYIVTKRHHARHFRLLR